PPRAPTSADPPAAPPAGPPTPSSRPSLPPPTTTPPSRAATPTGPVTTSTSTTATPSSTTSTITLPPEICGNCLDDDHDGLTDLEDPACCAIAGTMQIEHVRVVPRRGRSGLTLSGALHGMDLGALRAGGRDVVLQLRAADGSPFCARIPAASLVARKRGLRFKDPRQLTASSG